MPIANTKNINSWFGLLFCSVLYLSGCTNQGTALDNSIRAEEYRQRTYQFIAQKRYADGAKSLKKALKYETRGEDLLLLGDLQEALGNFRSARESYRQGLASGSKADIEQKLLFHAAMLEAMELAQLKPAGRLAQQLATESAEANILKAALLLTVEQPAEALQRTELVLTIEKTKQEMKGWAHYLNARIWVALDNRDKAFQALFFAINHARGHGLVRRITRLWEELKRQDRNASVPAQTKVEIG